MDKENQTIKILWSAKERSPEDVDFHLKEAFKILIPEEEILEFLLKNNTK